MMMIMISVLSGKGGKGGGGDDAFLFHFVVLFSV